MMCRLSLGFACWLGLILTVQPVVAQDAVSSGLISQQAARRYGMERAWFAQLQIDPARGRVRDMRMYVSSVRSKTVIQVTSETGEKYQFTNRQLDMYGQPLGVEGAKKMAARKQEALKILGINSTVQEQVVPDITLYLTTDDAMVQAVDAETGNTLWASGVGDRNYPTMEPAVSEKYLVIINGTTVYVLDTRNGKLIWKRKVVGIPAAGGTVAGSYVGVPMLTGELELYSLEADASRWPTNYQSYGQVFSPPTTAGNRIIWANASGDITAVTPGDSEIQFQLRTGVPIRGQVTYSAPDQLFAATETGYVYSFKASTGEILWRFSTGDTTTNAPIVVGNNVYVVTKYQGTFCIDAPTGKENWWAKEVHQFVAATDERVYGILPSGRMTVLDRQNGTSLGTMPTVLSDIVFTNSQTDRIYVASTSGLLQCIHVMGADWPLLHVSFESPEPPKTEAPETGAKPAPAVEPIDPFGGGGVAPAATPPAPKTEEKPAAKKPAASKPAADNPFG